MTTLEVVHLRLSGEDPSELVEMIRKAVGPEDPSTVVQVLQNAKLETDLKVHLRREGPGEAPEESELGTRLASLLRIFGMVDHSVWIEAEPPDRRGSR